MAVLTYQDLINAEDMTTFLTSAISRHKHSDDYRIARIADDYDKQKNQTINQYARLLYNMSVTEDPETGMRVAGYDTQQDFTASNNKLASNFFARLNTQRVLYSMGNGLSFVQPDEEQDGTDETKEALGANSDHVLTEAAYHACIHGVSFLFWNYDHLHKFALTEFVPLYDERNGSLRAGIRFWQLDRSHPQHVTLYREEGYSEWLSNSSGKLTPLDRNGEPTDSETIIAYKVTTAYVAADDAYTVVGEENYGALPIVPMWASRRKQSTLVGMRAHIDAYDLIKSGFANDVQDCATVYWIIRNAGGMTDADMAEFRDRLKLEHIAKVDSIDGADAVPYTQEIPTQAKSELLKELRNGIYEDFGALDVHTVAAGSTNDHIDAAYQPMDENAADFEYWVSEAIIQVLKLIGIDDKPIFTRNRISNQLEQVQMVVQEAQWLDTATVLRKLPNIRPDEVAAILAGMESEDVRRFGIEPTQDEETAQVF